MAGGVDSCAAGASVVGSAVGVPVGASDVDGCVVVGSSDGADEGGSAGEEGGATGSDAVGALEDGEEEVGDEDGVPAGGRDDGGAGGGVVFLDGVGDVADAASGEGTTAVGRANAGGAAAVSTGVAECLPVDRAVGVVAEVAAPEPDAAGDDGAPRAPFSAATATAPSTSR